MSDIDINRVKQNIKELQDQNAIDFQQWKRLGQEIEKLEGKIKTSDTHLNLLVKKIKADYESLKKIIIDENVQVQLNNKIEKNRAEIVTKVSVETFESEVNNINSQLNTKANKNEVFTMANMGQDIKTAMTGGSVAVVGVDSTLSENIVDGQVKARNTNFMKPSSNLLNPYEIYEGTVSHTNGNFYPNDSGYKRSGYIKIKPNSVYKFLKGYDRIYFARIVWFTDAKVFISGIEITDTNLNNLVSPGNAKYCVLCIQETPDSFINYYFGLANDNFELFGDDIMINDFIYKDDNTVLFESDNLYNYKKVYKDKLINLNENTFGKTIDEILTLDNSKASGYFQSSLIQVEPNEEYSIWYGNNLQPFNVNRIAFFNKDKKLIKVITNMQEFTIEENIKYISIGEGLGYPPSSFMIIKGDIKPEKFQFYKKTINFDGDFPVLQNEFYNWKGKKICTYGDSITEFGFWQQKVIDSLMFSTHYLRGISGSKISNVDSFKWWVSSNTGDYYCSVQSSPTKPKDDAIQIDSYFCNQERINTIPTDTDVILLMGGTNDMGVSVSIGETDYTESTFKGALSSAIKKIQLRIPHALIILMTPIYNAHKDIRPYSNAVKEVADEFGIPIIDVHSKCGINKANWNLYLKDDGTHPTYNVDWSGSDRIANVVIRELSTYKPYKIS